TSALKTVHQTVTDGINGITNGINGLTHGNDHEKTNKQKTNIATSTTSKKPAAAAASTA
ncbi:unnamed protein product, partial [Rotaria sp. Silwood1]